MTNPRLQSGVQLALSLLPYYFYFMNRFPLMVNAVIVSGYPHSLGHPGFFQVTVVSWFT